MHDPFPDSVCLSEHEAPIPTSCTFVSAGESSFTFSWKVQICTWSIRGLYIQKVEVSVPVCPPSDNLLINECHFPKAHRSNHRWIYKLFCHTLIITKSSRLLCWSMRNSQKNVWSIKYKGPASVFLHTGATGWWCVALEYPVSSSGDNRFQTWNAPSNFRRKWSREYVEDPGFCMLIGVLP